jgi:hypothetical protein
MTGLITTVALSGITGAVIGLYLLPLLLAWLRRVPDLGPIAVINILLGWTLVGWVIALALALRSIEPSAPAIQLVQNLPATDGRAGWPAQPWREPAAAPPLLLPPLPEEPGLSAEGDDEQW